MNQKKNYNITHITAGFGIHKPLYDYGAYLNFMSVGARRAEVSCSLCRKEGKDDSSTTLPVSDARWLCPRIHAIFGSLLVLPLRVLSACSLPSSSWAGTSTDALSTPRDEERSDPFSIACH